MFDPNSIDNSQLTKLGYEPQMNVAQLIDRLSQFPAEAPVWMSGCCMVERVSGVDQDEPYGVTISGFNIQDDDLEELTK